MTHEINNYLQTWKYNKKPYDVKPKKVQGINPMGFCDPWDENKITSLSTNMKLKQAKLSCNLKNKKVNNPTGHGARLSNTYLNNFKFE